MKLTRLTDEQQHILQLVVEEYFVVLPPALKVHSLFATHILSKTLQHFGIRTRVLPCRLWCSLLPSKRELVGGFVNFSDREKWNGHVVCIVGEWLVDAALYHLNPTFNYEVPKIIARRIALPEPGIYTRYRLNKDTEFIWYRLPAEVPAIPLAGYEDYIERFVNMLVKHINGLLGIVEEPVEEAPAEAAQEPEAGDSAEPDITVGDSVELVDETTEEGAFAIADVSADAPPSDESGSLTDERRSDGDSLAEAELQSADTEPALLEEGSQDDELTSLTDGDTADAQSSDADTAGKEEKSEAEAQPA